MAAGLMLNEQAVARHLLNWQALALSVSMATVQGNRRRLNLLHNNK